MKNKLDSFCIGDMVLVRESGNNTWCGVFDGWTLQGVRLANARHFYQYPGAGRRSLSYVAEYGINPDRASTSGIVELVELRPITILHIVDAAAKSIMTAAS